MEGPDLRYLMSRVCKMVNGTHRSDRGRDTPGTGHNERKIGAPAVAFVLMPSSWGMENEGCLFCGPAYIIFSSGCVHVLMSCLLPCVCACVCDSCSRYFCSMGGEEKGSS